MATSERQFECWEADCNYFGKRFSESDLTTRTWQDGREVVTLITECPGCQCDLVEVK